MNVYVENISRTANEQDLKNAKEAIICYLEGLEKVNHIKSKPKSVIKEIEVHV